MQPASLSINPATIVRPMQVQVPSGQVTYAAQPGMPAVITTPQYVTSPKGIPTTLTSPKTISAPALSGSTVIKTAPQYITQQRTMISPTGGAMPAYTTQATSPVPTTVVRTVPGAPGQMPVGGSIVRLGAPAQTVRTTSVAGAPQGAQPRQHTLAGPSLTKATYEQKHQDDPQLQNLKELRKTSGLKHIAVSDGLATLKASAIDGKLTREQFVESYGALLHSANVEAPPDSVQNAVFDLFDRDDNNVVDMMELICGISLLCAGSEDDKIHAVFNVFDENGDGFISMDEMFKFLTSVFKVVLTPNVMGVMNSMGVTVQSAEDLATVTALECFKTADLNHDGKLSVTEFKNWFYAPRNDPSFLFSPVRKLLT